MPYSAYAWPQLIIRVTFLHFKKFLKDRFGNRNVSHRMQTCRAKIPFWLLIVYGDILHISMCNFGRTTAGALSIIQAFRRRDGGGSSNKGDDGRLVRFLACGARKRSLAPSPASACDFNFKPRGYGPGHLKLLRETSLSLSLDFCLFMLVCGSGKYPAILTGYFCLAVLFTYFGAYN